MNSPLTSSHSGGGSPGICRFCTGEADKACFKSGGQHKEMFVFRMFGGVLLNIRVRGAGTGVTGTLPGVAWDRMLLIDAISDGVDIAVLRAACIGVKWALLCHDLGTVNTGVRQFKSSLCQFGSPTQYGSAL